MNILVTAGNTQTPIDRVRCITNIFSGRTGTRIALEAHARGHGVRLLTSHPEVVREILGTSPPGPGWEMRTYRTFDDLACLLEEEVRRGEHDAIFHVAAVSDFAVAGIYTLENGSEFDEDSRSFRGHETHLKDAGAGKVKSSHRELWLRLVPAPKLVDRFRHPWGFTGILVKFKLEVGTTEEELLAIAENSREQSGADLLVANTLEGMHAWALLVRPALESIRLAREHLARRLLDEVERLAVK